VAFSNADFILDFLGLPGCVCITGGKQIFIEIFSETGEATSLGIMEVE